MSIEHASEHIIITATPERCYAVASDFESYPEWASDIKSVEVKERDAQNRPSIVTFTAEALGRSTQLTVVYDYSKAPQELSWKLVQGDMEKQWDGRFVFTPLDDHTEVSYEITIDLTVSVPGFLKRRVESRILQTLNSELKARAEA
jgi:uncharacterized membrane protein